MLTKVRSIHCMSFLDIHKIYLIRSTPQAMEFHARLIYHYETVLYINKENVLDTYRYVIYVFESLNNIMQASWQKTCQIRMTIQNSSWFKHILFMMKRIGSGLKEPSPERIIYKGTHTHTVLQQHENSS